ncbi:LTA synthase family protein [Vibrio salinus]|uniref:LTA synthase family protein n=1 Tax=Vibrio salinus TaxID=2899784 RepID=UPI001E3A4C34|nr:LTA synthase family protein [Vibrio salinus]MCE0494138.1 LTA synthase family protein [Vibrio salinus]
MTYNKAYTEGFQSSFRFVRTPLCFPEEPIKPKNIIIFVFESWSNYHSLFYGGNNNWTPELDMIANQNIAFRQFYSNGFSTESGLYALLTGAPVIPYKDKYGTNGALGLSSIKFDKSYPEILSELGYQTTFITSGDLSFLQKRDWLKLLHFQNIIGNESFDKEERRFPFSSVSDEVLYKKVYSLFENSSGHFVVVENVNTHQPFYYPEGDEIKRSEEFAFRYADRQLSGIVKKLSRDSDNMIVVMSDHRAMTPITPKEQSESGRLSVSRVPMFIVWNKKQAVIGNIFQQTDVLPGITNAIKGRQCYDPYQGAIFPISHPVSSRCVFHARGDERSKVSAMCDGQPFDIVLDGDDTRISGNQKDTLNSVGYINAIRIHSQNRH